MENDHAAASRPVGMCEKLFNALHLNPALRSLHRIGYRPQEPAAMAATRPPPPPPSSVSNPLPPAKLSTLGAGVAPAPPPSGGASEKRAPERRPSRKESEDAGTATRAPSSKGEPQAAVAPPKTLAHVGGAPPPLPPPSRSLTEKAASAQAKTPAPARVVSRVEDVKASNARAKAPLPAAAAAAAAPASMVPKVENTKVNAGEMPAEAAERARAKKSLTGRLMTWSTGRGSG